MNTKIGYLLLVTVAIAAIVTLGGCKKKEQPTPKPAKAQALKKVEKTAAKTAEETKKTTTAVTEEAKKTVKEAAAEVEQTMCPVMDGNKIDKNVFVEYKGKKVYFCCPECKAKFQANPEKYLANLPQFKQ
jgi:YHS domain-containing protein